MTLDEYTSHDALGLAQRVRDGEVTAAELGELARRAAEAVNPRINAVVEHWPIEASGAGSDEPAGPLAGVPFLIKDLAVSMAGKRLELGSRLAQGCVATEDSWLMRRFRVAGLVTIGRSTTPEMAFSTTTESAAQGATRNPWALDLSAGGSSGGAAAAVAAGIVPLAHATDAAGSIRVPAACNGLFGLKPTRGRSSNGPALDEVFAGFGVQLGVSRSVRDSAALLDAIQGQAPGDPYVTAAPARSFLSEVGRDPGRLTIAMRVDPWNGARIDPAIAAATRATARELEALGHRVEELHLPLGVSWEALVAANATIWCATLVGWIDAVAAATGRPIDATTLEPATLACYRHGREASATSFAAALDLRNRLSREVGGWFERFDLLMTPTLPRLPPAIGTYARGAETMTGLEWTARVFEHSPFTPAFNVAGVPAMSVPLAHDAATGLPIGIQFVAGFAREATLLRLAAQLEQALPWSGRRPPVWAGSVA
ncbi:amidase [Burkholderia gladioli]|uniref:amidase n=1 Tax=Burkholderia gladioli TaxID=28095 RepID=UPI00163EF83D|nr:amidase [Burkholderia gladioli]